MTFDIIAKDGNNYNIKSDGVSVKICKIGNENNKPVFIVGIGGDPVKGYFLKTSNHQKILLNNSDVSKFEEARPTIEKYGAAWKKNNGKIGCAIWSAFAVAFIIIISIIGNSPSGNNSPTGTTTNAPTTSENFKPQPLNNVEADVPMEFKSALNKADSYANTMNMSKKGVYDQLVSSYGESFSKEAAKYAIDNVKADWNANALAKAEDYQNNMSMSPSAIRNQLTSSAGEKFTKSEADFAITHLKK